MTAGTQLYLQAGSTQAQLASGGASDYALVAVLDSVRGVIDGAGILMGTTGYAAFGALRATVVAVC